MKRYILFLVSVGLWSPLFAQPLLTNVEYFIDADPGRGLGTSIVVSATNINILENVPTTSLTEGFHLITVRAQDQNGVWGLPESKPFFVTTSTTASVNNINAMEYFIDTDPGRGSGVSIPITPAMNLNILENVPTTLLTEGFHLMTVRAQDDKGNWSLSESKPFFVTQSTTLALNNINAMEYFIDADPGRGSGVNIPITPAMNLNILENVPTTSLTEGFHLITVRAQDDKGNWSLSESKPFFVTQSTTLALNNINAMEYFIDADPGRGSGVSIPITPAMTLNILENVPTAPLTAGFHLMTVRAQYDKGNWSLSESKPFFVTESSTIVQNKIMSLEYFIDTDPGIGLATSIPITASTNLNILENIPTAALSTGIHLLYVRGMDEQGNWSFEESKPFFVDLRRQLVNLEYAVDTDPGIGLAMAMPIVPPKDSINILLNIPTSTLTIGAHNLIVRTLDNNIFWSKTNIVPFSVCDGGTPDFSVDLVCQGTATTFTDLSFNVLPGDIYSWDFDGDAIIDATTQGNQAFTFPSAGTYNATLTIDRAGCSGTQIVPVQVEALTVANAGLDQSICIASATLAGNALGANESGQWQLVTGAATITTPTDPLSTITGITTNSVELSWTVTNSVGGCSAVDNVVVTTGVLLNASMSATSVCLGNPTDFTDNSTNVLAGDVYAWDFDGDAITDANTQGNQTFTFTTAGTYNASLSITRATCVTTSTVVVDVFDAPVINAGPDQSVCTQSATFAATALGINETGVWSVLTGIATLGNSNDPVSTTSITSGTAEFTWTVTNTVTGCVSQDTVLISANQPITANAATGNVDIGQSINVDVQNTATTNPGDLLTTSITTPPASGAATVLADGTIDYTPDAGSTGSDMFTFRITNQCSNFSESTVTITVNNAPPSITPPTVIPAANTLTVTIDLSGLITDPNNNIDLSSLTVVSQPISGATASIDAAGNVTIDYTGITFTGQDMFDVMVCDLSGACTTQTITIDNVNVGLENPPISVYNAVSPNGDGYHDFLEIKNIEFYSGNLVIILNRWGSEVDKIQGYNNQDKVFRGNGLPSGVYYYVIQPGPGSSDISGDFVLKLDN